jgi:hypothetical protein
MDLAEGGGRKSEGRDVAATAAYDDDDDGVATRENCISPAEVVAAVGKVKISHSLTHSLTYSLTRLVAASPPPPPLRPLTTTPTWPKHFHSGLPRPLEERKEESEREGGRESKREL